MKHGGDIDTSYDWRTWNSPQRLGNIRWVENQRINRDHLDYIIVEIRQNTEKSSGTWRDLLSLRFYWKVNR